MISSLLWFGLIALFFFMMMRAGCGRHVMGHRLHDHGGGNGAVRPPVSGPLVRADETATDPVCGMRVATATARSSVYRGAAYYFCSAQHRDAFEENPAGYLKPAPPAAGHEEAHNHG